MSAIYERECDHCGRLYWTYNRHVGIPMRKNCSPECSFASMTLHAEDTIAAKVAAR